VQLYLTDGGMVTRHVKARRPAWTVRSTRCCCPRYATSALRVSQ